MNKKIEAKKLSFRMIINYFFDFLKSKNSWYFYIIVMPILFIFCNSQFHEFFTFSLIEYNENTFELAEKLIDSRIINISALFSIAFVIIGFTLNKINNHHPVVSNIVLKNAYIFISLYYSLSLIGSLIIISSIRYIFEETTFINMYYLGTFLILLMLFLIGFMFVKVISLINFNTLLSNLEVEIKSISHYLDHNFSYNKNQKRLSDIKKTLEDNMINSADKNNTNELKSILDLYHNLYFKKK